MLMQNLETALSLKRGHGTETEAKFVAWLCKQVQPTLIDGGGNIHVELGTSRTMFTAHTDTVHHTGGVNSIKKTETHWYGDKDALGADDGCGIALMLSMIAAGVPGRYVFFRGEECGGIGSKWLAQKMPDLLKCYDRAIAFDRAGLGDVITHQAGGRCCSDKFAIALSDALNVDGMMYMPDASGVYTDTAEFIDLIPECTNLSVGYAHQHGPNEELNLAHFQELAQRVLKIDWESLPTVRVPEGDTGDEPWAGSSLGSYKGLFDAGDLYWDAMDAIERAFDGDYRDLVGMMAESMYPEDKKLAISCIKTKYLTEEVLATAFDRLSAGEDVDSIMLALYDAIPITA